jgi:hypothetical protein
LFEPYKFGLIGRYSIKELEQLSGIKAPTIRIWKSSYKLIEEEMFEKILNSHILRFGFEKMIIDAIYPFLEKIVILWQTRNITRPMNILSRI